MFNERVDALRGGVAFWHAMVTAGSYDCVTHHPEALCDSRPGVLGGQAAEQDLLVHVDPQVLLIRYFSGMN
jgi:hypothetical protein